MNTRILKNIEGQSSAQSGARTLTEEEMDAIAGGTLISYANGAERTFYINEAELRRMFLNDQTKYKALVGEAEHYKAIGFKLGTIVERPFSMQYLDIPPAFYGEQGVSGN